MADKTAVDFVPVNKAGDTMTGTLVLSGAPVNPNDAATKNYVDTVGSGLVDSVTGTANRITITGTAADPVVDIAATYVGQASITTLGTITTGVWNGTAIPITAGGTNATDAGTALSNLGGQPLDATLTALAAYNTNGLLTQTAADTFTGRTLTGTAAEITVTNGDGVAGNPTLSLPAAMTMTGKTLTGGTYQTLDTDLAVADGGTGVSSHTAYAVLCGGTTGTGAIQSIASVGTSGHVLTSNGAGALPTFQASAGGAPTGATYITQTSNGSLTNEQALDALASGIMYNTTGTGVVSIATEGTDYYGPGGTDVVVADGGTGRSTATAYAVLCGGTTATGAHQSIASVGTSGQVLTSNGAGALPTFQAAAGGGGDWTLVTTVTISNDATVDLDNIFDSTYECYYLVGNSIVPVTDATQLICRMGTGATPTYQTGASDYAFKVYQYPSDSSSVVNENNDSTSAIQLLDPTAGNKMGNGTGENTNFILRVFNPASSTYYTLIEGSVVCTTDTTTAQTQNTVGHYKGATTAVTSIQFYASSGNLSVGEIRVYGLSKS